MGNIMLSVIVPVYNCAHLLPASLESLIHSGEENAEYIIVDDGSEDESLNIARKFTSLDPRFKVFSKKRGGPSSARNMALSVAKGEYVTFLDADDRILKGGYLRLSEIIKEHKHPDLIVFGAKLFPSGAPEYLERLVSTRDKVYKEFVPDVLFSETGARPFLWLHAVKRDIITKNELYLDEDISLGEDQLFQMSYIPFCRHTVFVRDKLYLYRWQSFGSIMSEAKRDKVRKLSLHIDLTDRAFSLFESRGYDEKMRVRLLDFAISFVYHDLINLRGELQFRYSSRFIAIIKKHRMDKLIHHLGAWCEQRYRHITLMASEDPEMRIRALQNECDALEKDLLELRSNDSYKRYMKKAKRESSLFYKGVKSLKESGVRVTLSRVRRRLGI